MELLFHLIKLESRYDHPVQYSLNNDEIEIDWNILLGEKLSIKFQDKIHCIKCGRETKKSFAQGYCYPCFISAPETEDCVLKPELCQAHLGIARDMKFAENHCLIDHYVYLALTSALKVGVTRNSQVPARWIDQGAWKVIKLARTPNRYLAGNIEVFLKDYLVDKTNWRHMLSNKLNYDLKLEDEKKRISGLLHEDFQQYVIEDNSITELEYPVLNYPEKIKSLSLDKIPAFSGRLEGIKGQYLIFDQGRVFNVRKHNGYLIKMEY